jgi:hypothetical protein
MRFHRQPSIFRSISGSRKVRPESLSSQLGYPYPPTLVLPSPVSKLPTLEAALGVLLRFWGVFRAQIGLSL